MGKREMEELLGLGHIQDKRRIPGTELVEGREFRYVRHEGGAQFGLFFTKLIWHVDPPIPSGGGAMIEGCEITLPSGELFQAISYKGDIDGWRSQVQRGAEALKVSVARISGGSIVLGENQSFLLSDCKVRFY